MKLPIPYFAPKCEVCDAFWESLICASDGYGNNEDIGFEDWSHLS